MRPMSNDTSGSKASPNPQSHQNGGQNRKKNTGHKGDRGPRPPHDEHREEKPKKPKLSPVEIRRVVAKKMVDVFTAIKALQKEAPNRWNASRRSEINLERKLVQSSFDAQDYEAADRRLEHLIFDYKLPVVSS